MIQKQTNYLNLIAIPALVLAAGCSARAVQNEDSPPTTTYLPQVLYNLPFPIAENRTQMLDIYLPQGAKPPVPVVLALHGGGGDKSEFKPLALYLATGGYALVAPNFRDMPVNQFPAGLQDAYCAYNWLQLHAPEYGIDSQRIILAGFSLGGSMAALMATIDNPSKYFESCPYPPHELDAIRGSIIFTGIFDFPAAVEFNIPLRNYFTGYFGSNPEDGPDTWKKASAVTWLDGSEPPFLLIHGLADGSVSPENSRVFAERLKQAGVEVELLLIPGARHLAIISFEGALEASAAFITSLR